jgi:predicted AAA+ superfamily ATPase
VLKNEVRSFNWLACPASSSAKVANSSLDEGSVESQLAEAKDQLADAKRQLMEVKRENAVAARRQKLDEVLSPLEGSKREQMEIILNKVPTEKLAETYSRYIGIIMKESVTQQTQEVKVNKIFTGNAQTPVTGKATQLQEAIEKAKKLAGIL